MSRVQVPLLTPDDKPPTCLYRSGACRISARAAGGDDPIRPVRNLVAAIVLALVGAFLVTAAGPAHASSLRSAKVLRWIDGDTVRTTLGTVRLIGIDTPERGRCGSNKATRLARRLAPVGSTIRLTNPGSVQDTDKYGRLLRYVNRGGVDVGARQIRAGAVARYDSLDGYDHHPRQRPYRKADRA